MSWTHKSNLDQTVEKYALMKVTEFFQKRLHAPLVNPGWSWGAVDEQHKRIFLRVHEDGLEPDAENPKRALVYDTSWSNHTTSPGDSERVSHLQLLQNGYTGYAVIYWSFWNGKRWTTKDFERRFLFRLGTISKRGGRTYASIIERVPVENALGTSAITPEESDLDEILARDIPNTVRKALIKARVGQGTFRDQVLQLWSHQCAVTGCEVPEALRASHIKAWSESTDEERLNPYNGLPLLATLDALFDKHLIAFDANGRMLISSDLSKRERELLLPPQRQLRRKPNAKTTKFLKAPRGIAAVTRLFPVPALSRR